jgi:uncharacterized membrane protein YbhN (UPF0104 family)
MHQAAMNKRLTNSLKGLLIVLSIAYIAYKLYVQQQHGLLFLEFEKMQKKSMGILLIVLLLMLCNWSLEGLKWRCLVNKLEPTNLLYSVKGVLAGVSVSIFTPNRIGEFGGRIFFLHPENRASGIAATLLGNLAQLLATLLIGMFCLLPFTQIIPPSKQFPINPLFLFLFSFVVIGLSLYVYFNVFKTEPLVKRLFKNKKQHQYLHFLKAYNKKTLLAILGYSLFRYLVFSAQFIILLHWFGINLSTQVLFISISQIYLIMTLIPTFALSEVGVRGSVAVLVLGFFTPLNAGVIAASVSLWIINLAIPALLGSLFLLKLKIE